MEGLGSGPAQSNKHLTHSFLKPVSKQTEWFTRQMFFFIYFISLCFPVEPGLVYSGGRIGEKFDHELVW